MKSIKTKWLSLIYDYIYIPLYFNMLYFRDMKKMRALFGGFESLSRSDQAENKLFFKDDFKNVCGFLSPEIVKIILDLRLKPGSILLDGDSRAIVSQIRERFNFEEANILTAGLDGDFDYAWNFEDAIPPNVLHDFDLIVSQAMFEHLIDPYKHFEDLSKLLKPGGYLVIHSHLPEYTYHRYPIDAVRFFPDWFEFSAKKLGLTVKRKFLRNFHIFYSFQK